jgi:hypothetical protein
MRKGETVAQIRKELSDPNWKRNGRQPEQKVTGYTPSRIFIPKPPTPVSVAPTLATVFQPKPEQVAQTNGSGNGLAHANGQSIDRSEAERRLALAKAQKEEMLVAERQGLVVEFETVRQYVAGMIVDARNQLLRLPAELCDRLGAMGAGECRQLLDQEIRQALGKLKEFGG